MILTENDMEIRDDLYLQHYGTPRHSGRYPWGSGENPYQRNANFLNHVTSLKKQGIKETEIAKSMGLTTGQLRAKVSVASSEKRAADVSHALELKDKGYSNMAIGREMGVNESTVRSWLDPAKKDRKDRVTNTADALEESVKKAGMIDVGAGVENSFGVSETMKNNAISVLEEKGYKVYSIPVEQMGTGKRTIVKVLADPSVVGTDDKAAWKYVVQHKNDIATPGLYSVEDGGRNIQGIKTPVSIDSKRIKIRYNEDGGVEKDGVIEIRRGVDDLSLGDAHYAQVRIAVDGTHYLKGMAMYSDKMPDGYDIIFNTNKHKIDPETGAENSTKDVLKKMKIDKTTGEVSEFNPFGATIKEANELILAQREYIGADGKKHQSAINVVNEEGNWEKWTKSLSSQVLSKQPVEMAKKQLDKVYKSKEADFEEIESLTNPTVKKHLLNEFADGCDSAAVELRGAALPRQSTHVILPFPNMKETEVYAPNYNDGEKVALIRYPHAGRFEIPVLTVNNKNKEAKSLLGSDASDAIGINHKVAERLSGADFDGDTVQVIPIARTGLKYESALKSLQGFEPKEMYKLPDTAPQMKSKTKQTEMGKISNLITDMTIKGAPPDEIARAVKHSMVVIDAEKHHLDYKRSYQENGIAELKKKYQDNGIGANGKQKYGASTLISKAGSEQRVHTRRVVIDPDTGEKKYVYTDRTYTDAKGKTKYRFENSTKMAETKDAYTLSSGTPIENVYAEHANKLKSLANRARKEALNTKDISYSSSANKTYKKQVDELSAALKIAQSNAPLERKAQIIANEKVKSIKLSNPDLDNDDLKKYKSQALKSARDAVGAGKQRIQISDKQWEAIQAGAVSKTTLEKIISNTDSDTIKKLATPRSTKKVTPAVAARINSMAMRGATQAEIAEALGLSTSTVLRVLNG